MFTWIALAVFSVVQARQGQTEARGPHAALQRIFAAPSVDLQMCSLVS